MSASASVLVAHSYYLTHDPKQVARMKPYSPLATLIAASVLRERGHDVTVFDAMVSRGEDEFEASLRERQPRVVAIVEDSFNFLTKMCTTRMREAALRMIRSAKGQGCAVVVNGSDAADQPAVYLAAGADAIVVGEAEATLAELVDRWVKGEERELRDVPGLVMADRGAADGVRRTGSRPVMENLDRLPLPAWDLIDANAYRTAWTQAHGRFSWNVATSRGCPYGCNWCAKPIFGRRYAQRSPQAVADELARLARDLAPDHIWFADDIFGLTTQWIEAFAMEVRARNAVIPFTIQSRVNLMTASTVAALRSAGCEEVWMGVESGAQHVLDAMDKGSTVAQARDATQRLRDAGIRVCWFIQLGYPGEGWTDVLTTRDLVRAERPDDIGVSVAYPLPGTEFHRQVESQLRGKRNWTDSGDLAMLFRGPYRTTFYRRVRDLLHAEVSADDGSGRDALDRAWSDLADAPPGNDAVAS